MKSNKARALSSIRAVIGPETCGAVAVVWAVTSDAKARSAVNKATTTAHQLRHALATTMVLLHGGAKTCPNCGALLPAHADDCHVGRLLSAYAASTT